MHPALLGVVVLVAALFALWLYSREKTLPHGVRFVLAFLRAIAYAMILAMLFRPIVGLQRKVTVRRNLLVLVDRSASMAIVDKRSKPADLTDSALAPWQSQVRLTAEAGGARPRPGLHARGGARPEGAPV